jgi:hypothetical protein
MAEFPVNDEDIKALRLRLLRALAAAQYPKEAIGPIAANNGLQVGDVKSLVNGYGYPDKGEMARHVIELSGGKPAGPPATPQQVVARRPEPLPTITREQVVGPARPAVSVAPVPEQPAERPPLSDAAAAALGVKTDTRVETLLSAASKSSKARTRRLGVRIHELVAELRGLVNTETAEREAAEKAAAEQAKLRAEVEQLEQQLSAKKALLDKPSSRTPKQAAADGTPPKEIRAWAAANGIECPAVGRLPGAVVEAYEAAKGAA